MQAFSSEQAAAAAEAVATVDADGAGERLDQRLAAWASAGGAPISRSGAARWIALGCVTVDGRQPKAGQKLRAGQRVAWRRPSARASHLTPHPLPLEVLFEDDHLLVVNKPAGLPVHPGAGVARPTLVEALLAYGRVWSGIGGVERPGIVHRLDADTTGALVVAKHDAAHRALAAQFAARQVHKAYVAIAVGRDPVGAAARCINTPYGRHPLHRQRFTGRLAAASRRARTLVRVRGTRGELAWVDVRLLTGRTHQARVHLAEAGLPIVADALYGGPAARRLGHALGLASHALHAHTLGLRHPVDGRPLAFEAPLPAAWRQAPALAEWIEACERRPRIANDTLDPGRKGVPERNLP